MTFRLLLLSLLMLPVSAHAEKTLANIILPANNAGCNLTETTTININFNSIEKDLAVASTYIEKKTAEIQAIAKEVGVEKLDITSVNYSLSQYNSGYQSPETTWQFSGSMAMSVVPSSKGKELLVALSARKYQPSLNVSAYRNGNCNN